MKVLIDTRKFRNICGAVDLGLVRNELVRNGVRFTACATMYKISGGSWSSIVVTKDLLIFKTTCLMELIGT